MAYERPTLTAILDRVRQDISLNLPGADALLRRSSLGVLATVLSGVTHGLYGFIAFIFRQLFFDTALAEYLERWAAIWGIGRQPASLATGTVTCTGIDGSVIPAGSELQRIDGVAYVTTAEGSISAGTVTVPVSASESGAGSNMLAGTNLSFATTLAGVESAAVAAADATGGADVESDDALRARFLARVRRPPHGGAGFDYLAWALEVAGVTRAWVYAQELGLGTVTVRFVMDDKAGTIIPDAAEVQAVQDHIDPLRPVTADVTVVAPTPVALDFTITPTPDTSEVRAAIQAELEDMLLRDAEPGGAILISRIREAVSIAAGEENYVMSSPAADVAHSTGEIAVMGTITFP